MESQVAAEAVVKFSHFSSVLEIAFALNALVSYIQNVRKRGSRQLTETINDALRQFEIDQNHQLYARIHGLQEAARNKYKRLAFVVHSMSLLTVLSSTSALGLLIYAGFCPQVGASVLGMSVVLSLLLLLPLFTLGVAHFSSYAFRRSMVRSTERLAPELEAAGLNREHIIRIPEVAKLFAGIRMEKESDLAASRGARRLWNWITGRMTLTWEGEDAEELQTRLMKLQRLTGQGADGVIAYALALMKVTVEHLDNYTVIFDKSGREVKRIKNRDLIDALRAGKNPFED